VAKKGKAIQPDDYFSAGPIQVARFGKNIVCQADWPAGEFDKMQQKLIERFPEVVKSIDNVISKITSLVEVLPPEKVLQRAWGEMAVRHMGIASEVEINSDDAVSLRMVDYLQSVIVAIKPSDVLKEEVADEDWQVLRNLVGKLFDQLNHEYQICKTAVRRSEDPELDMAFETYCFKAQVYWCNIRGHRYLYHEEEHLSDLISPHSDALTELFGITSSQLIEEILKIQHALTRGMTEAGLELKEFQRVTTDALELKLDGMEEQQIGDIRELMAEVIRENGWEAWQVDVFGRFLGFDLFDLEKVTQIPKLLLEELSWEQGQDTDFFSDGEFRGWPLRIWPIFKRPFVKFNDRYYCFELYSLLDNIYRVLQRIIIRLKEDYRAEWNKRQMEVSEQLPFKYIEKLLPNSQVYQSVYYRWNSGDGGKNQWCEADGLLIYDDHLFVIEVKAGAFTYTSPANDFPAYLESIKNLVLKPAIQGKRFVEYLNSATSVDLFDKDHNKVGEVSKSDFRQITICPITLDTFTELASQVQHLKALGVDVGDFPVWAISIDDLRVYSDVFCDPLVFLHFVEQRMRAFASDIIQTDDELDHVGLYVKHNVYTQYAKEILSGSKAQLNFLGYRSDIDRYFTEKLLEPSTPSPLRQEMPARLVEIINVLSIQKKRGRAAIASYLLDCGGSWRDNITEGIEKVLGIQKVQRRPQPLSTYGDIKLTIFCWQNTFVPRNEELALDHARAAMLVTGDKERLMLELDYTDEGILDDVSWSDISMTDVSNSDKKRLTRIAETLKARRIAKAGRIGRNVPCPCGSGKKYKRCCIE